MRIIFTNLDYLLPFRVSVMFAMSFLYFWIYHILFELLHFLAILLLQFKTHWYRRFIVVATIMDSIQQQPIGWCQPNVHFIIEKYVIEELVRFVGQYDLSYQPNHLSNLVVHETLPLQIESDPFSFEFSAQIYQMSLCTSICGLHFDCEVMISFGSYVLLEQLVYSLVQ